MVHSSIIQHRWFRLWFNCVTGDKKDKKRSTSSTSETWCTTMARLAMGLRRYIKTLKKTVYRRWDNWWFSYCIREWERRRHWNKNKENRWSEKDLRPLERTWRNQKPKTMSCVSKDSNRNIRNNIYSRNDTIRSSYAISGSVSTKGRLSFRIDILDWQANVKDRIRCIAKDHREMWIQ